MSKKKKKTIDEEITEYLRGQGAWELTEEEKNSPVYKGIIESARRIVKEHKC
jgi:hypothetical protein